MVTEPVDPVLLGYLDLIMPCLAHPQVIKAEITRQVWLAVPFKQGARLSNVRPLGETLPPPAVILGYRVKLREVKSDKPWCTLSVCLQRSCVNVHVQFLKKGITRGNRFLSEPDAEKTKAPANALLEFGAKTGTDARFP